MILEFCDSIRLLCRFDRGLKSENHFILHYLVDIMERKYIIEQMQNILITIIIHHNCFKFGYLMMTTSVK